MKVKIQVRQVYHKFAEVEIEVSQRVNAVAPNYLPNWNQALVVQPNTRL